MKCRWLNRTCGQQNCLSTPMLLDQVVYPATVATTAEMRTVAIVVSGAHVEDANIFNKLIARGVLEAIKSEPLTVKNALVLHLLTMGWTESHHGALETIAARYGIPRETMSRATKRLVELGLLEKRERGRIEVHRTRPSEYRITERLKQFAQKPDTSVTSDHTGNPNLTDLPGGVTSHHTSTGVTSRHPLKKKDLTTTNSQASNNKPLNKGGCEQCGGAVMLNPQGQPNPLCKPCYVNQLNKTLEEKKQSEPPEQYGLHHIDLQRVEFIELPDGTVERKVLWGPGTSTCG